MLRAAKILGVVLTAMLAGCAPPIGVAHLDLPDANRALTVNILSAGELSVHSGGLLQRLGLRDHYQHDAPAVLAQLHKGLDGYDEHERLLALAELSFAYAQKSNDRPYFLAAAAYAWTFLIAEPETQDAVDRYDERFRLAADLYNRGVALGLAASDGKDLDLTSRRVDLFFGPLDVEASPDTFTRGGYRLVRFVSLADYKVHGLRNHYRRRGIGAPVSCHIERLPEREASKWIPPTAKLPATLLLVFDDAGEALEKGHLHARVEIHDANEDPLARIDHHTVPLETDSTAALAYRLEGSPVWDFEIAGFRRGDLTLLGPSDSTGLFMIEPYRPGRIPVVFVHGTASSPARWAEMVNEVVADARLAAAYQFWFFIYNTGNPIAYSAMKLREGIKALVPDVDPAGTDAALRRMVLIGHSQGGLLVRMMVVDSGTRFWQNVSDTPFEQVKLKPDTRELLQKGLFFEPLPTVERVIFVATPHRGSFVAENWLGNLARRLVRAPATLMNLSTDLLTLKTPGLLRENFSMPTAVDNMRGTHPFVIALNSLPINDRVHVHSIIAVKGNGPAETGNDGVVAYPSAHLDDVESELVVRSPHSCQGNPAAIEEVRRILYEHLAAH